MRGVKRPPGQAARSGGDGHPLGPNSPALPDQMEYPMKVLNRIARLFSVEAPARSRLTASFRPALEALEDRLLMSASGRITSVADADGRTNHQYAILPGAGYPGGTLQEAITTIHTVFSGPIYGTGESF